jgi:O-acetyl-ADP-ribose deacetylase (regulator of RNase III)
VVSSANTFGIMDGGSDAAYLKVFGKQLESATRQRIATHGLTTALGRSYLPVGSAITVPTGVPNCPSMICAPTMVFPSDIRGTDNVYFAFFATLQVGCLSPDAVIAITLMGMGYGKMDANESADSITRALTDYCAGKRLHSGDELVRHCSPTSLVLSGCACAQRDDQYCNKELVA